ncbi:SCP2 domain-containing protein [Vibrio sp. CK2-1]|uniref:ubiquinone biosynthesis accessory factor UbiJ n=1 Tax=Vibrio sp. CK2-1 TaxID=2912249 RepID=UPI001F45B6A8|nr:SCP2 domain-containing protein [Vibrio sp. CK2-1]MCF7355714.1 SCP2 domain-containing protein [Vibrio sp. CK2-1]
MPFEPLVTGIIETTLNRLILDAPEHQKQVARLKGKVIKVHIQELDRQLIFVFSHQVDVLSHYEAEPDCYLSLKLAVLPELKDQSNITRLIKQDKLVLEGDIQLAQKFSQLMTDIKPDPEEWLSRATGDIVAHTVVQSAKSQAEWLKQGLQNQQRRLGTVVTQEWQIAPNALEVAYFCDQVDELAGSVSVIEQRLERLVAKL